MDIEKSLKKIVFVDINPDLSVLKENEREALRHCVNASKFLTEIYLTQIYSGNISLRDELSKRTDAEGKNLYEYFQVNGGPWDIFNEHKPFVPGIPAQPKGGSFYPADLTEQEWNEHLATHPEDRDLFESPVTVIVRGANGLQAVPYSEVYKDLLNKASDELDKASALLEPGSLKELLALKAKAFRSNDYFESDMHWIDTDGHPFEVTIGPYESYADEMFGIKAMFESFIALPDKESTEELQKFSSSVPEFDATLAPKWGYKPKGAAIPLEVVADVFRGGEGAFGRQFVAYNLPNDRKIHESKGSKKVFSRTMMEAKFKIGEMIAKRVLKPEDLKHYYFRGRLLFVLGHELAHGLGPGTRNVDGREVSFEVLLKELHSSIEEAKADMLGMALLQYFQQKGLVTEEEMKAAVITEMAGFVQGWRASFTEAHSLGSLIEYNWLKSHGAVNFNVETKVFDIEINKTIEAMVLLADEFIRLQTAGNYDQTAEFIKKWGFVSEEIPGLVASLEDLPIEVHSVYS